MLWVLALVAVFMIVGMRARMSGGARHLVAILAAGAALTAMFLQFPPG